MKNKKKLANLVDIRDIKLDTTLPLLERKKSLIRQLKNPYQFKYKNIIVNIEFIGSDTIEQKLMQFINNNQMKINHSQIK